MVVLPLGLCISLKQTVEYGFQLFNERDYNSGSQVFLLTSNILRELVRNSFITITYFIHTSVLKLGFSVLRAPKMTSPSMNDTNPISLCQAFKAAIPAALTAFCDMRKNKFLIYLNTLCI